MIEESYEPQPATRRGRAKRHLAASVNARWSSFAALVLLFGVFASAFTGAFTPHGVSA